MNKELNTKFKFALILAVTAALFVGCGVKPNNNDSSEGKEITIKHELGETKVPENPERVVVLEFSFVDTAAALGVKPVGIADDKDPERIIEEVRSKVGDYTSVGERKQPNLETISTLKPDLIVADVKRHSEIYNDLNKIAPTIALKSLESSYDEVIESFKTMSKALGKEAEGEKVLKEHEETINTLKKEINDQWKDKKVMPVVARKDSFNVHTSSSFVGQVLSKIGIQSAIESNEPHKELTLDQLAEINPDKILFLRETKGTIVETWSKNPLWDKLTAKSENQIFQVENTEAWSRFRGIASAEVIIKETAELMKR